MKDSKTPVSMRALIQRINRALAKEEEVLKTTRGERWFGDLGRHYVMNFNRNFVVAAHVDPEQLGRELKVLKAGEVVGPS